MTKTKDILITVAFVVFMVGVGCGIVYAPFIVSEKRIRCEYEAYVEATGNKRELTFEKFECIYGSSIGLKMIRKDLEEANR